jgi:hypothetical protein
LDGIIGAVDSPFKVLVLDQHSTKIISAACTMTDITSSGISRTCFDIVVMFTHQNSLKSPIFRTHNGCIYRSETWRVILFATVCMCEFALPFRAHAVCILGTVVEALEKGRQPLPRMDAIYFITPTEKSINLMLKVCLPQLVSLRRRSLLTWSVCVKDFENPNASLYKAAHLFFTDSTYHRCAFLLNVTSFPS